MMLQPVGVEVKDKTVELSWSDGHRSVYRHSFLRQACPCAACKGEPGLFGKMYMPPNPKVAKTIKPISIGQVGRYALRIEWSDGHASGIYTFTYLREICQCKECAAKSKPAKP